MSRLCEHSAVLYAQTVCMVTLSSPCLGRLVFLIGGIALCKPLYISPIQQVQVEFLDYGGSELVSLSSLKHLPERCRHLPFQAVKASLDG